MIIERLRDAKRERHLGWWFWRCRAYPIGRTREGNYWKKCTTCLRTPIEALRLNNTFDDDQDSSRADYIEISLQLQLNVTASAHARAKGQGGVGWALPLGLAHAVRGRVQRQRCRTNRGCDDRAPTRAGVGGHMSHE